MKYSNSATVASPILGVLFSTSTAFARSTSQRTIIRCDVTLYRGDTGQPPFDTLELAIDYETEMHVVKAGRDGNLSELFQTDTKSEPSFEQPDPKSTVYFCDSDPKKRIYHDCVDFEVDQKLYG